jgi:two-component system, sensor histidine kinase and response regulator
MTTVLVIEDTPDLLQEIMDTLTYKGFDVFGAGDGLEGVQIAQEKLPDLIICDVTMPQLDGYDTLKLIQENESTSRIPFIFLTAYDDHAKRRQCMDLGADDYLTKPFASEDLFSAIAARLKKQSNIEQRAKAELDILRSNLSRALPHELRTPLNGIMGFSELLIEALNPTTQTELLEMAEGIHEAAKSLNRVIQNFLLYAELQIISNNQESKLITNQTTSAREAIAYAAKEKAVEVNRVADLHLELTNAVVRISTTQLTKIVEEIIDNCFKFSDCGTKVEVISSRDRIALTTTFTDYGRGMTPPQIANIDAYMQFERKVYEQQGSGLGLTIARRLTEIYNGTLTIESILGKQTTVKLVLPLIR